MAAWLRAKSEIQQPATKYPLCSTTLIEEKRRGGIRDLFGCVAGSLAGGGEW